MGREKATGASLPLPFQILAAWVGVWVARHQANQMDYLKTVNRVLLDRLGTKRLRFTDAEAGVLGKESSGEKRWRKLRRLRRRIPGARGQEI